MTPEQKSDFIFCVACNRNLSNQEVMALCGIAQVPYPPEQIKGTQQPVIADFNQEYSNGVHC